jgi:hypothetical protein
MRIAYIAPYQGPDLMAQRPIVRNLSLGGRIKTELFAELFRARGHEVELFSQGEVIERGATFYPAIREPKRFHPDIPVHYASCLPVPFVNGYWSGRSTLSLFKARHRQRPFDLVLIYNLKVPQVVCSFYALERGVPVILEYEDDHFTARTVPGSSGLTARYQVRQAQRLLERLGGVIANSPGLMEQIPASVPRMLLSGVIGGMTGDAPARRNWVVFSGTHAKTQGLSQLVAAWKSRPPAGWELHIAGRGDLTAELERMAAGEPSIVMRGVLDRETNVQMLRSGRLSIVPFDVAETRGFSFKTLECLGAGLHVITTRLSALEGLDRRLLPGITFIDDNSPETISRALHDAIARRTFERTVTDAALELYGPAAVAVMLEQFAERVVAAGVPTPSRVA